MITKKKKRKGILLKPMTFDQTIVALAKIHRARGFEDHESASVRSPGSGVTKKPSKTGKPKS